MAISVQLREFPLPDNQPADTEMGYKAEPGFNDIPHHTWWIKGKRGGVHIWARQSKLTNWPTEWIGGVEVHLASPPEDSGWFNPDEPSHADCWLLNGPCWHDGTSLYFSERIAPLFAWPDDETANDFDRLPHHYIGFELVHWFNNRIAALEAQEKNDAT